MKTIFDQPTREQLVNRINALNHTHTAQWGKMNLYQMLKHLTIWNDWVQGTNSPIYKQELLGFLFGKWALKGMVKDDSPMKKGMPAGKAFTVKEKEGDINRLKQTWINQMAAYGCFSNTAFIHDFFGRMTQEEIGILAYKHSDHHLRQFGV